MTSDLNDIEYLRRMTEEFVRKAIHPYELEIGQTGIVPPHIEKSLRELGYFGITTPEKYGGAGLSHLEFCVVLEELSKAPKPVWLPLVVSNGLIVRLLMIAGSEDHRETWLAPMATGEILGALAVTEPDAGSDVQALRTRATKVRGGWQLNGTKHFITLGARAAVLAVLAKTEDGPNGKKQFTIFLVPKDTPGFSVARLQETMAGPPAEHAELVFSDCFVPDENMVGPEGGGLSLMFRTFDEERISMSVTAIGCSARALELSVEYAKGRHAFGQPIGNFQAVQAMLANMATEIQAARSMTYDAARRLDRGERIGALASMVKLFTTEVAGRAADNAVQVFGGIGYTTDSVVSRIYRDVRIMRISGGTSEIQRGVIARSLLGRS